MGHGVRGTGQVWTSTGSGVVIHHRRTRVLANQPVTVAGCPRPLASADDSRDGSIADRLGAPLSNFSTTLRPVNSVTPWCRAKRLVYPGAASAGSPRRRPG